MIVVEHAMPIYWELKPPSRLVDSVECFWISEQEFKADGLQRVVPDGCADIIYTRIGGKAELRFVGAMTQWKDFPQPAGVCSVGVRFRPSMWADILRVNGEATTDRIIPLNDLWNKRAVELSRLLETTDQPSQFVRILAQAIPSVEVHSPLQRAIRMMEKLQGQLALDSAAAMAELSARQFRRRCIEATGLTPKKLNRILRFRQAANLAATWAGRQADLAAECGYADQSHLIAECRKFAGRTAAEIVNKKL